METSIQDRLNAAMLGGSGRFGMTTSMNLPADKISQGMITDRRKSRTMKS
jgi:hypothetical protein